VTISSISCAKQGVFLKFHQIANCRCWFSQLAGEIAWVWTDLP